MPDTPTPNPSDPDPSASEDTGKKAPEEKPRLKLKRLVIKDVEINPHINPDAEPVPHAVPIDEPDPEPEAKPPAVEPPAIEPVHPPVEEETKVEPEEPEEQEEPEVSKEQPEAEKTVEEEVPPGKPEPKPARKGLAKKAFALVLISGSLIYGIHVIFDPLGLNKPEPIVPRDIPIAQPAPVQSSEPEPSLEEGLEISRELATGEVVDVADYLTLLAEQDIRVSNLPEGVFINSVFYAPGAYINPDIGLSFVEVQAVTDVNMLIVKEESGTLHEIPFQ